MIAGCVVVKIEGGRVVGRSDPMTRMAAAALVGTLRGNFAVWTITQLVRWVEAQS